MSCPSASFVFFFSSRRRHTRWTGDWSSDVCSSDLHEKALLNQIERATASEGRAIVDFHHWWHNPLRRLGLLPQNFGNNRSYTRSGAEGLLRECGVEGWRLVRFYQEFAPESTSLKRISWLLPATRLLYE